MVDWLFGKFQKYFSCFDMRKGSKTSWTAWSLTFGTACEMLQKIGQLIPGYIPEIPPATSSAQKHQFVLECAAISFENRMKRRMASPHLG